MPSYDYNCKCCGWRGELQSVISLRNDQLCPNCSFLLNRKMSRPQIVVPLAFGVDGDPCAPDTEWERKIWDEDGVTSKKSRWV